MRKFEERTPGRWNDIEPYVSSSTGNNEIRIYVKDAGDSIANNVDYELMIAAPQLFERVAELEKFISDNFVNRMVQPYSGATPECQFCGSREGSHVNNCPSKLSKELLERKWL